MQQLPQNNQCHKCHEWFGTVHVCAIDVKAAIDEVFAKGVKQTWVARQLGVHDRTVMAVVNRTGAYALVPKSNAVGKPTPD